MDGFVTIYCRWRLESQWTVSLPFVAVGGWSRSEGWRSHWTVWTVSLPFVAVGGWSRNGRFRYSVWYMWLVSFIHVHWVLNTNLLV